jgi:hypothetical protein
VIRFARYHSLISNPLCVKTIQQKLKHFLFIVSHYKGGDPHSNIFKDDCLDQISDLPPDHGYAADTYMSATSKYH